VVLDDDGANLLTAGRSVRNARRPAIGSITGLLCYDRIPACASGRPFHVTPETLELGGEGAAAAAAARGVRVLEGESGALHRRHIVDGDAVQVLCRERVDEDTPFTLADDRSSSAASSSIKRQLEPAAAWLDADSKAALPGRRSPV
jgi:hypothetical protein